MNDTTDDPRQPLEQSTNWIKFRSGITVEVCELKSGLVRVFLNNGQKTRYAWIRPEKELEK